MATTYVPLLTNHFGQFNQTKAADLYPNTDFDGLNVVEKLWGESGFLVVERVRVLMCCQ
jgi:hypothetical protein